MGLWTSPGWSPTRTLGDHYDVLLIGGSVPSLFCAAELAQNGCRVALLDAESSESALDLGVVWPGLAEHWGVLLDAVGAPACESLLALIQRSLELLTGAAGWEGRRGATLQLANNPPEWAEMSLHLDWINTRWPRRLMSGGSASNYLTVGEVAGAAFVQSGACFDPAASRAAALQRLEGLGVDIHCGTPVVAVGEEPQGGWAEVAGQRLRSEVLVVGAGHRTLSLLGVERPWLFPLRGAALRYRGTDPWNPALAAVESYRGHLMFRPGSTPDEWIVGGLNPGASWEAHTAEQSVDAALTGMIHKLAVRLVPSLGDQEPEAAYPLIYTYTADGLPLVGPLPGSQRTWLLAGLASRSWSLGPALGQQVAHALLQQPHDLLTSLPQLRPTRWMRNG